MTPQAVVQGTPAPAPLPPLPPLPAVPTVTPQASANGTLTFAELMQMPRRALTSRRDELSRQLSSVSDRRKDLVDELRNAPSDAVRTGIESRISLLDQRINQIESDIAVNGRAIAAKSTEANVSVPPPPQFPGGRGNNAPRVVGIVAVALLFPLAFAMARRVWRGSPPPVVRRDPENDARLERIEQAVDAIAIEVERISEAQRFQNKLLSEGQAVGAFGFARAREGEKALG